MDAINGLAMGFSVLFTPENLYFCFSEVWLAPWLAYCQELDLLLP
jgi:hypothetical protein